MRTVEPTERVLLASSAIARAVGELLNSKHLYHSVFVEVKFVGMVEVKRLGEAKQRLHAAAIVLDECDWIVAQGEGAFPIDPGNLLPFDVPVVKTSCRECKEGIPFHVDGRDKSRRSTVSFAPQRQVFCIPMLCQGCRREPLVFMISRKQRKLTLTGRESIEITPTPHFVLKWQARYHSEAIIGNAAARTLAGLFYLRTLIEQYMRSLVGDAALRGEDLIRAYAKTLDPDMSSRLPSFGHTYEKLRTALHEARDDQHLFADSLRAILEPSRRQSGFGRDHDS